MIDPDLDFDLEEAEIEQPRKKVDFRVITTNRSILAIGREWKRIEHVGHRALLKGQLSPGAAAYARPLDEYCELCALEFGTGNRTHLVPAATYAYCVEVRRKASRPAWAAATVGP